MDPISEQFAIVTEEFTLHGRVIKPGQLIRYTETNDLILNLFKMNKIIAKKIPYKGFEVK